MFGYNHFIDNVTLIFFLVTATSGSKNTIDDGETEEGLPLIIGRKIQAHFSNQTQQLLPRNLFLDREGRFIEMLYRLMGSSGCYLFSSHSEKGAQKKRLLVKHEIPLDSQVEGGHQLQLLAIFGDTEIGFDA